MDGQYQARLDREGIIGRRGQGQGCLEATSPKHPHHKKMGKKANEGDSRLVNLNKFQFLSIYHVWSHFTTAVTHHSGFF